MSGLVVWFGLYLLCPRLCGLHTGVALVFYCLVVGRLYRSRSFIEVKDLTTGYEVGPRFQLLRRFFWFPFRRLGGLYSAFMLCWASALSRILVGGRVFSALILSVYLLLPFSLCSRRRHGGMNMILDNNNTGKVTRVGTLGIVRRTNVPVSCVTKADVKTVMKKLCTVNCAPRRLSDVIQGRG